MECQNTAAEPHTHLQGRAVGPNPLAVLKLVMAHCKRMQERMMGQLAAAENRHRRVRGNAQIVTSLQIRFSTQPLSHMGSHRCKFAMCVNMHVCLFQLLIWPYSSEADREGMWSFSTPKLKVCEDMCGRLTILVFFPLAVCLIDDSRLGGGETTTRPGVCTPC